MHVYLDNSATTRQSDEVTEGMLQVMRESWGNPSSLHHMGMQSEKAVRAARKKLAATIGAKEDEIVFTSCGTESDNTALFGVYRMLRRQGNHIITTKIEHPAILQSCRRLEQDGAKITYIGVNQNGFVDMEALEKAITEQTILVSVMHVNNESGAIQPIREIASMVHRKSAKAVVHCDAVQSFGKLPVRVHEDGIDLLSASAHKIHGPKGMGFLYVRKGIILPPYLCGGGQEHGLRSGTENVPGIIGFGIAAEQAGKHLEENRKKLQALRDYLLEGIRREIPDICINSPEQNGLPYILNVSFSGTRGEVLLHMLEQQNIYVSTGSACSSHGKGGSHVLQAMERTPEQVEGAIRFSFSVYNTMEEMDYVLLHLKKAVEENRRMLKLASGGKRR